MANPASKWSDQYKDPRWQKMRLKIMERDGFKCQDCASSDKTLNVHHNYYIKGKKPWEYPSESLHTLCESCHKTRHELTSTINQKLGNFPLHILNQWIDILAINDQLDDDEESIMETIIASMHQALLTIGVSQACGMIIDMTNFYIEGYNDSAKIEGSKNGK